MTLVWCSVSLSDLGSISRRSRADLGRDGARTSWDAGKGSASALACCLSTRPQSLKSAYTGMGNYPVTVEML
jgi:hypothetical protein